MGPPRTTVDMKPLFCSWRASLRWSFELGIEVKPRRALEALLIWEQIFASSTRDMVSVGVCEPRAVRRVRVMYQVRNMVIK